MEGSSFWVSRVAKPWHRRIAEGSGGSGARFWTRGFCLEMASLLVLRVAKPWQGVLSRVLAVAARAFGPVDLRGS